MEAASSWVLIQMRPGSMKSKFDNLATLKTSPRYFTVGDLFYGLMRYKKVLFLDFVL